MNSPRKQKNRTFSWILHLSGVATTALLLIGFYGLVYKPLQSKQAKNETRLEQVSNLLQHSGSEGAEYRRLRNQLDEMKQVVKELQAHLAEDSSPQEVVEQLGEIASAANLRIVDYQIGLTDSKPTHSRTEVEFSCLGSYASICNFLDQAEQLTKTTKLSRFELEAKNKSRHHPIQLTFVLYSEGKSNDRKDKRGVL